MPMDNNLNYCNNCGNKLIDNPTYCSNCGKKLLGNNNEVSTIPKISRSSEKLDIPKSNLGGKIAVIGLIISLFSVVSCQAGLFDSNKDLYDLSFTTTIIGFFITLGGFAVKIFK